MGVMVDKNARTAQKIPRNASRKKGEIDLITDASKERAKVEKRLEKEYARIRLHLEDVRSAFSYVDSATSHQDISFRLRQLEKATRKLRTGGAFSRGAKLHRRLLKKLQKMPIE